MAEYRKNQCAACGKVHEARRWGHIKVLKDGWLGVVEYTENGIEAWHLCPECARKAVAAFRRELMEEE